MAEVTEFASVLMNRDGLSREEADYEQQRASEEFYKMMEEGAGYDDVEDFMAGEYGLEMDYIFDLI